MKYKYIIFDFDGVLVESNEIRLEGFILLFSDYPLPQVKELLEFARLNAGLSRYEKIRYFFEKIRNEAISEAEVNALAKRYSGLVKQKMIEANPVKGSIEFLLRYHNTYELAIVSGSDQQELIEVCEARRIKQYFVEILGSPASKELNLSVLFQKRAWEKEVSVYIGDSVNDLNAARSHGIDFIARDSGVIDWGSIGNVNVINDLSQLPLYLT